MEENIIENPSEVKFNEIIGLGVDIINHSNELAELVAQLQDAARDQDLDLVYAFKNKIDEKVKNDLQILVGQITDKWFEITKAQKEGIAPLVPEVDAGEEPAVVVPETEPAIDEPAEEPLMESRKEIPSFKSAFAEAYKKIKG